MGVYPHGGEKNKKEKGKKRRRKRKTKSTVMLVESSDPMYLRFKLRTWTKPVGT
jgi:hypothetical protein